MKTKKPKAPNSRFLQLAALEYGRTIKAKIPCHYEREIAIGKARIGLIIAAIEFESEHPKK